VALTFCVGALPFLFSASACAQETTETTGQENRWLDDYKKPVGFTYGAKATLQTTYIWRGLYAGGLNLQTSGNVGYGGLYFDMWWNIGTTDWEFRFFQPEVDLSIGFSRWGLDIFLLYVHNFEHRFFDLGYHDSGRNALELDVRYTISSKLPLSLLWATRFTNADAYINTAGDTIKAYSSYMELSYTHHFPYDISLYGAFGITPWRSLYTDYQRNFAVQNIELRLRKDWSVHERIGLMLQGQLSINPSAIAADKTTAQWHPKDPGWQSVNANIGLGIYLK
jgi:hypothetical protein